MSFSVRRINDRPQRKKIPWSKILTTGLVVARPVLGLYHDWKRRREAEKDREERIGLLQKALLILIAVFFGFLLLSGIVKAVMVVKDVSLKTVIGMTGADLLADEHGYTNFLLLGHGDPGHEGVDLMDTIMIASVDPNKTHSVAMLSFPRDTYFLHTEKMGAGRINSLYRDYKGYLKANQDLDEDAASEEALQELAREIGNVIDLDLHYVIKVNFSAFTQAVDALGGVDLEVPYDINDQEYPNENFGYEPFVLQAGLRHLDGATALKYARSRHTSSDFGRAMRQQQLLSALGDKAKENGILTSPSEITNLVKILSENMETTMTIREMISLANFSDDIDRSRILNMTFNDQNGLFGSGVEQGGFLYAPPREEFGGAAVFLPVSIPEFPVTWKQITVFAKLYFQTRDLYLQHAQINVLNAGASSGAARVLGGELYRYGFDIKDTINTSLDDRPDSVIIADETNTQIAEVFGSMLGIPVAPIPTGFPPEELAQITIILGEDYDYTPLQDLLPSS